MKIGAAVLPETLEKVRAYPLNSRFGATRPLSNKQGLLLFGHLAEGPMPRLDLFCVATVCPRIKVRPCGGPFGRPSPRQAKALLPPQPEALWSLGGRLRFCEHPLTEVLLCCGCTVSAALWKPPELEASLVFRQVERDHLPLIHPEHDGVAATQQQLRPSKSSLDWQRRPRKRSWVILRARAKGVSDI